MTDSVSQNIFSNDEHEMSEKLPMPSLFDTMNKMGLTSGGAKNALSSHLVQVDKIYMNS